MDLVKSVVTMCVGVTIGLAAAWFMMPATGTDGQAEVGEHVADLGRRLDRLERTMGRMATSMPVDATREIDALRQEVSQLTAQVASPSHASFALPGSADPEHHPSVPQGGAAFGLTVESGASETRLAAGQIEGLVTDLVTSLTPRYLEEQVSQLYTAQKQADEAAQQEAEQHRRDEAQARRLAQMVNDLQTFVPGMHATQMDEVAQAIREQWEIMATLRQQAQEQGTFVDPGEILRQAREVTDEKLYVVLSAAQLEAFRHWRETRFGAPEGASR
jgi:hypothetical protein